MDSLHAAIARTNTQPVPDSASWNYSGYFMDNRNKKAFFIDFEKEINMDEKKESKKEIKDLFEFVDKKISWSVTYGL